MKTNSETTRFFMEEKNHALRTPLRCELMVNFTSILCIVLKWSTYRTNLKISCATSPSIIYWTSRAMSSNLASSISLSSTTEGKLSSFTSLPIIPKQNCCFLCCGNMLCFEKCNTSMQPEDIVQRGATRLNVSFNLFSGMRR
ncbi:unnamed protein product [Nesidiocoris tenuis]|uniref:Uncharacterized protein n=1 Tax=Nesidiocoris tenuis TaxID=355587 RepID=A0A6H5FX27_9HEMI|nr:unnamed protein product [Nesidiocoris tenuis]